MSILYFLIILIVLVWVHELGHFSLAKLFGIRVDEFAIGFPPRLFTVEWGETRYSFNLLLVGGYVSIYGDQLGPDTPHDPRSFAGKPRYVQAAVMVGGILFNIAFAWVVLTGGYLFGLPSTIEHDGYGTVTNARPTIVSVLPDSPAEAAGVAGNDIVVGLQTGKGDSIDLRTLNTDQQAGIVHDFLVAHADESIVLHVTRNGAPKDFIIKAASGIVPDRKVIGVELDDVGVLKLPPQIAILQAGVVSKNILVAEAQGLGTFIGSFFVGRGDVSQVSGPIGIVSVGSQLVAQGFGSAVTIIALISINLALINIIPIPGLDGGRLLFIAIEGIIRRPLNSRVALALTVVGFALIITLMVYVSAHDIAKLVG